MSSYISAYFTIGEITVSKSGSTIDAVKIALNADLNEVSEGTALFIETAEGYLGSDIVISLSGTNSAMWRLALTEAVLTSATWGAALTLGSIGHGISKRKTFYIQAKAVDTELPKEDLTVTLVLTGIISADE